MFSFFKPKPKPADLQEEVFRAVIAGGPAAVKLCQAKKEEIWAAWPGWVMRLMTMQSDPGQAKPYAEKLQALAVLFHQELGDPRLMRAFGDVPGDQPVPSGPTTPEEILSQARGNIRELRLEEAIATLTPVASSLEPQTGPGARRLLTFVCGDLAQAHFFSRQFEQAERFTQRALELCREQHDQEGVENYRRGLYELYRYQNRRQEARRVAEQDCGGEWARRARTVETEPLLRVQLHCQGGVFELEDLPEKVEGRVQFAFERNRITLYPAEVLASGGRQLAERGRMQEAVGCFLEACRRDPYDPEGWMLLGLTFLDVGDFAAAVAHCEKAEELAPGYFHVRSDLWFARQFASGQLDFKVWELWRKLEDGRLAGDERRAVASALGEAGFPAGGAYHQALASLEADAVEAASKQLRQALSLDPEPHLLTRIQFRLGSLENDRALLEAASRGADLVTAAMARLMLAQSV